MLVLCKRARWRRQVCIHTLFFFVQAGIKAAILERSSTLRQSGAAIALQTNAFRAINLLGQACGFLV